MSHIYLLNQALRMLKQRGTFPVKTTPEERTLLIRAAFDATRDMLRDKGVYVPPPQKARLYQATRTLFKIAAEEARAHQTDNVIDYVYPSPDFASAYGKFDHDHIQWLIEEGIMSMDLRVLPQYENAAPTGNQTDFMYAGQDFGGDPVNGADLFEIWHNDPHYYPNFADRDLIAAKPEAFAEQFVDCDFLIEFGAGLDPTAKTLPILQAIQKLKKERGLPPLEGYIDVDTSQKNLDSTYVKLLEAINDGKLDYLSIIPMNANFNNIDRRLSLFKNAGFLFIGNTGGNVISSTQFPNPSGSRLLSNISRSVSYQGAKGIIGIDATERIERMMLAYSSEDCARWTKNILHLWARDLGAEFKPALDEDCSDWLFFVRWNPKQFRLEFGIRPKEAVQITLPRLEELGSAAYTRPSATDKEVFNFKQFAEFHTWNSEKIPADIYRNHVLGKVQVTKGQPGSLKVDGLISDEHDPYRSAAHFRCQVPARAPA